MKQIFFSLFICLCSFVLIATLFFTSNTVMIGGGSVNFQSKDGGFLFTCMPSKGRDYKMMERQFEKYKEKHALSDETKLYRVTSKNYFKISKWSQYKLLPEWNNYPYLWVWNR